MDPNVTLSRIHDLVVFYIEEESNDKLEEIYTEINEACDILAEWLQKGGFPPDWADYPYGEITYMMYLNDKECKRG
jgi:hypothetical protein